MQKCLIPYYVGRLPAKINGAGIVVKTAIDDIPREIKLIRVINARNVPEAKRIFQRTETHDAAKESERKARRQREALRKAAR